MRLVPSLRAIKLPKRPLASHSSLPFHETPRENTPVPSEKHGLSDREDYWTDEEYDSTSPASPSSPRTNSSRDTSGSHDSKRPMIQKRISSRRAKKSRYRVPQKIARNLCYAVASTIVIFILFLVRMSAVSSRYIETKPRPPPPRQWESFPFLKKYYAGVSTLVSLDENQPEFPVANGELRLTNETTRKVVVATEDFPSSNPFVAYPDYSSSAYLSEYGPVQECFVDGKAIRVPALQSYKGRPMGFPDHVIGSYSLLNLPEDICFDRYGKLGPYGHGYSLRKGGLGSGRTGDSEGSEAVWSSIPQVDYMDVDWAMAQKTCFESNSARFKSTTDSTRQFGSKKEISNSASDGRNGAKVSTSASAKRLLARTAVIVRTWDDYIYGEEDILFLRSLITELSLGSGGEYDIHLLVQVKDEKVPVFADEETYQKHLEERIPGEFRGMATLWSESQMNMLYHGLEETWARGEGLPVHGVYRGLVLAFQYFAHNHPEYEFFWQWEMDLRYTGHFYDLLSKFDSWSRDQPRKGLWERNSRYYVPSVHGTWDDFRQMVRLQTESGTESASDVWSGMSGASKGPTGDKPIWGPERSECEDDLFETENDPIPPTSYAKDNYIWGVGEDADLITLNPIFDPEGTTWGLAKDITGYNRTGKLPPRRAAIITASRLSKRLLTTMHRETAFAKHHAFPEMWPATAALHHGYKAVYIPHPMFVDREWPVPYLAAIFNGGRNGATGGAPTSVYGEREHNLLGITWYYNAGFPGNLWRRWLGLKVDNEGGEVWETQGVEGRGGEGRMCLPPMLLHPVKNVELPVEEVVLDHDVEEFDPAS